MTALFKLILVQTAAALVLLTSFLVRGPAPAPLDFSDPLYDPARALASAGERFVDAQYDAFAGSSLGTVLLPVIEAVGSLIGPTPVADLVGPSTAAELVLTQSEADVQVVEEAPIALDVAQTEAVAEPVPVPEPTPEPISEPIPEPISETTPESTPESAARIVAEAIAEPAAELAATVAEPTPTTQAVTDIAPELSESDQSEAISETTAKLNMALASDSPPAASTEQEGEEEPSRSSTVEIRLGELSLGQFETIAEPLEVETGLAESIDLPPEPEEAEPPIESEAPAELIEPPATPESPEPAPRDPAVLAIDMASTPSMENLVEQPSNLMSEAVAAEVTSTVPVRAPDAPRISLAEVYNLSLKRSADRPVQSPVGQASEMVEPDSDTAVDTVSAPAEAEQKQPEAKPVTKPKLDSELKPTPKPAPKLQPKPAPKPAPKPVPKPVPKKTPTAKPVAARSVPELPHDPAKVVIIDRSVMADSQPEKLDEPKRELPQGDALPESLFGIKPLPGFE